MCLSRPRAARACPRGAANVVFALLVAGTLLPLTPMPAKA